MFGSRNSSGGRVCQFFLEGRCKFGDNCKNEHPRNQQDAGQNRFAPLQEAPSNHSGGRSRSGALGGADRYRPGQSNNQPLPYYLSYDTIKADLTPNDQGGERPIWPLSSYGPGRDAPRQLLEGAIEQSFEEVRLEYYVARASGNEQSYLQTEKVASDHANQQTQKILSDLDGAVKYVVDGENQHPNRIDQVVKSTGPWATSGQQAPASTFGGASATGGSAFGQPSSFGAQQPSGFRQQSSQGQGSAFGQSSMMAGVSAFGQPSSMGQKPAFGQATAPGGSGSAFSQPSSLGSGGSAFGQPSSLGGQKPAFGQPSGPAFGQSGSGQASAPAFGTPSQPTPGFGQASALGTAQSPFGQSASPKPSPFAAPTNQPSPFAQAASGFGQPSSLGGVQQQPSAFGQPSALGHSQQQSTPRSHPNTDATTPFGGPSNGQAVNNSPFAAKPAGSPAFGQPSQTSHTTFGQPTQTTASPFGQAPQQTSMGGFGRPNGATPSAQPAAAATANVAAEGPADAYVGELGAVLKDIYEHANRTGQFKDGVMPEIPPKRDWIIPA